MTMLAVAPMHPSASRRSHTWREKFHVVSPHP